MTSIITIVSVLAAIIILIIIGRRYQRRRDQHDRHNHANACRRWVRTHHGAIVSDVYIPWRSLTIPLFRGKIKHIQPSTLVTTRLAHGYHVVFGTHTEHHVDYDDAHDTSRHFWVMIGPRIHTETDALPLWFHQVPQSPIVTSSDAFWVSPTDSESSNSLLNGLHIIHDPDRHITMVITRSDVRHTTVVNDMIDKIPQVHTLGNFSSYDDLIDHMINRAVDLHQAQQH